MSVVAMSHGELSRYDRLRRFERGELRIEDAAMLLGVCRRQAYRLLDRLRADGPEALISWKRGRRSNRDFGDAFWLQVLNLVREHYHDLGPTLISEHLAERQGIKLSHEILRKLPCLSLPSDTDIAVMDGSVIQAICVQLNSTPHRCLGFRTLLEVFAEKASRHRA
ncbi:helix-turn-helix domain-containing protein [Novosphingobium sp. G106]|uniref:helix-turn-helix domain-containing protein n=1 Tax=Novosphingobium sp. G106 TaxID=2849500 RepID=UPI001C2D455C|nr:helix-turn-helix domain-containing protein [Novosphingobium sp. G106]MBV1692680.1 helix-turn-helix domain-containing protein [Novosphingobium sp. G106]